ncbi:hypothetical protein H5T58_01180 [Candidatus Parcubacteria bacterium]|nr:hypothetical protein [Candidatus Parcubacteria bacterium]
MKKLITVSKIPILIIAFLIDFIQMFFPLADIFVPGLSALLSVFWALLGFLSVGLWSILVSGKEGGSRALRILLGAIGIENIPFVSCFCPSWTFVVLSTKVGS